MTRYRFNGVERAERGRASRGVCVVVCLRLAVENDSATVVVFLIVHAGLGQVGSIGARGCLVDRNEGWLNGGKARSAVRIVWISAFRNLESIGSAVAIGINQKRVRAGVRSSGERASIGLNAIEKTIIITILIIGIRARGFLLPIIGAVVVRVGSGRVGFVNVFLGIIDAITIEVAASQLSQISGKIELLESVRNTIAVGIGLIKGSSNDHKVVNEEVLIGSSYAGGESKIKVIVTGEAGRKKEIHEVGIGIKARC